MKRDENYINQIYVYRFRIFIISLSKHLLNLFFCNLHFVSRYTIDPLCCIGIKISTRTKTLGTLDSNDVPILRDRRIDKNYALAR